MSQRIGLASVVTLLVLAFAGCGDDGKGPGDDTGAASSSGAASSGATGEMTGGGTTGDTGGPTSSSSSTGPAPVCESAPGDSACTMCNNANCCAQIMNCQAEPACDCMTGCVTGVADISMCTQKCGTSKNFSPLSQCGLLNCVADCT